mmetsp:Transcript_25130/g.41868  ORF Transcript_25130/g.41868 Transcript_25130/m.41868 type:complete len:95 (+) Transcript_25130:1-285(+)
MKWSADDDNKSLAEAQKVLDAHLPALKALPGVKKIQRIVCGGCFDFKVILSFSMEGFGTWGQGNFTHEESFLAAVKAIPGISQVETQVFTIEEM